MASIAMLNYQRVYFMKCIIIPLNPIKSHYNPIMIPLWSHYNPIKSHQIPLTTHDSWYEKYPWIARGVLHLIRITRGSLILYVSYGLPYPICSMYGIFTNICPKNHPNVGKYTIHRAYGYGNIWPQDLEFHSRLGDAIVLVWPPIPRRTGWVV